MMQDEIIRAFNFLVPRDQIIIESLIVSMYEKDKSNHELVKAVVQQSQAPGEKGTR